MNDLMRQIHGRKVERRKQLVALPVGEKLHMLEEMMASMRSISASRPPKPVNVVHRSTSV
jgi:hypothetical protein